MILYGIRVKELGTIAFVFFHATEQSE